MKDTFSQIYKNQKPIIANGVADRVHRFVGLKPVMELSDLVRDVKDNASNFINDKKFMRGRFSWQEGLQLLFVFTFPDSVYQYILNQEETSSEENFPGGVHRVSLKTRNRIR